ncbi:hypothetical protein KC331_g7652 [Hortaea werneckii]|nr:hypothetical protein KC331_g7652 [Hortaea werneckii]KAI7715802.1 hypothetical protein KC353_g5821 [Hortaea werneckii]
MFTSTVFVAVGAVLASLTNAFPIVEHPAQLIAVTATPSPRVDGREAQVLASVPTPSARLEERKDKDDGVETIYTFTLTRSATLAERHHHTDDGVETIYTFTPTRAATLVERHHNTNDGVVTIYTFTPTHIPHATLAREPRAEESPLPASSEQAEPHLLISARMMRKPGCDIHWTDDRFCSYDEPGHHHHDKRDAGEAGMSDVPGYYHEDTFKPVCWPEGNDHKPEEYSDVADCGVLTDSAESASEASPGQAGPSVSQVNQKLTTGGHRVICSEEGTESGPSAPVPRCEELQGAVDRAGRLATGFSDAEKDGFRVHVSADKGHGPVCWRGTRQPVPLTWRKCPDPSHAWE